MIGGRRWPCSVPPPRRSRNRTTGCTPTWNERLPWLESTPTTPATTSTSAVAAALADARTATCRRCLTEATVRGAEALARVGSSAEAESLVSSADVPAVDRYNAFWRDRAHGGRAHRCRPAGRGAGAGAPHRECSAAGPAARGGGGSVGPRCRSHILRPWPRGRPYSRRPERQRSVSAQRRTWRSRSADFARSASGPGAERPQLDVTTRSCSSPAANVTSHDSSPTGLPIPRSRRFCSFRARRWNDTSPTSSPSSVCAIVLRLPRSSRAKRQKVLHRDPRADCREPRIFPGQRATAVRPREYTQPSAIKFLVVRVDVPESQAPPRRAPADTRGRDRI